jgi:hypothetical protein
MSALTRSVIMSIRERISFLWKGIQPLTVIASLVCGGLAGAIYTQWRTSRPADIKAQLGDYAFAMGKPLIGLLIVLPNHGFRPGVVTSIEIVVTSNTPYSKNETTFENVFVSGQLENLRVLPSGRLDATGDSRLSLFAPLTVSAGQTTSALVWFQPRSHDFVFDGSTYECRGELKVWSGRNMEITQLPAFSFTLAPYEADALNKEGQKNVLLPVNIKRSAPSN